MIRERIIWLFLLSAVLAYYLGISLPRSEDETFADRQFWINKTFAPCESDVVLIGDSRTYRGIDPTTISNEIGGKKVFNFGYSSGGFSLKFINAAIEKLNPKGSRVVVFCITPNSLTKKACKNEQYELEFNRKKEEILEAKYFSELAYFFRPTNLQYYLQKRYLVEAFKEKDSLYYHQQRYDNGWVASWKLKHEFNEAILSYKKEYENNLPELKSVNTILSKVKELKKLGYVVIGLRIPVQKDLFLLEKSVSSDLFDRLKNGFKRENANWIDVEPISNSTYDASHLHKWGAIALSKFLGKEMKKIIENLD